MRFTIAVQSETALAAVLHAMHGAVHAGYDFFDGIAGAIFVDGLGSLLTAMGSGQLIKVIVADGLGGGIQIVATFIPIIAALYLFLSAIEDSGYMARAAFVTRMRIKA